MTDKILVEDTMDAELKTKWVKALRSGKYTQATGGIGSGKNLCCIGVCGAVMELNQKSDQWLTVTVAEKAGFEDRWYDLVEMNDNKNKSFKQIANWIEKNL